VMGEIEPERAVLVRVHLRESLCDLFGARREDCAWPLRRALAAVSEAGHGVLVVLGAEETPEELLRRMADYDLEDRGVVLPRQPPGPDLRGYGLGAQILTDLGVRRMRVLSAPKRLHGIAGFGLEVVDYVTPEEEGSPASSPPLGMRQRAADAHSPKPARRAKPAFTSEGEQSG
jgi:3,4-dihydroxy 2-butanone 4-phosphate synthase/GTP cyclohydrolase II